MTRSFKQALLKLNNSFVRNSGFARTFALIWSLKKCLHTRSNTSIGIFEIGGLLTHELNITWYPENKFEIIFCFLILRILFVVLVRARFFSYCCPPHYTDVKKNWDYPKFLPLGAFTNYVDKTRWVDNS